MNDYDVQYWEWVEMAEDEMHNEEIIAEIERMIVGDIIDESEAQS